jgi:hypothetical protein
VQCKIPTLRVESNSGRFISRSFRPRSPSSRRITAPFFSSADPACYDFLSSWNLGSDHSETNLDVSFSLLSGSSRGCPGFAYAEFRRAHRPRQIYRRSRGHVRRMPHAPGSWWTPAAGGLSQRRTGSRQSAALSSNEVGIESPCDRGPSRLLCRTSDSPPDGRNHCRWKNPGSSHASIPFHPLRCRSGCGLLEIPSVSAGGDFSSANVDARISSS